MNILYVIPFISPEKGGSVAIPYINSVHLKKMGNDVTILTTDFELNNYQYYKSLTNLGIKVIINKTNLNIGLFVVSLGTLNYIIHNINDFNVIHMHEYRSFQNIVVSFFAKLYKIPYIVQAHGSLTHFNVLHKLKLLYDVLFGYKLLKGASKVIAFNQKELKQYVSMGVCKKRIEIVSNPIDFVDYVNLPLKNNFKKKYNIPETKKIILYVGRIHKLKGIEFLISSYAYLIKKMNYDNTVLVLVGPDSGYLSEVKRLVKFLNIDNSVFFTGYLFGENKVSSYVDSVICIYPSPWEQFGIVTLEAAASGTPVIVVKGTPMACLVDEGKFGFSVKYGDEYELSSIMKYILDNNEFAKTLGQNGRRFVFENFDLVKIGAKLEKIYNISISEINNRLY